MSIYTKLLEIQKLHLSFEKDAKNPFFKSNYVSLDSIVEKLTPHLDKQWLLVYHFTESKQIVTEVVDTEDDSAVQSSFPLIDSNDPQKLWSCITYAKRYNLGQLFNIVTDRDDDGNEASEIEKKEIKKEYVKKQDEDWLTLDDYIDSIKMEKDWEHVKTLYFKWLKLCTTDKQADFFTGIKDKRKKELWL